jgi:ZIP family zinc transporter
MNGHVQTAPNSRKLSFWISILIPIIALGLMLSVFAFGDPLTIFKTGFTSVETISFERVRLSSDGFEVDVVNGGPNPVTIAQVQVDEAYWEYSIQPEAVIPRLGRATLHIPYPWVEGELHVITVLTNTGLTFETEVPVAVETPSPGRDEFLAYGLLGIYVGIIPVGLGMLWFPAMRQLERKWLGAVLALTIGLLVFLLIDTLLEAFEFAEQLPGVFQGIPLTLFAGLLTWLILQAIGSARGRGSSGNPARDRLYLATLIAIGIGLHNLGEGMAIGAAFAIGEAALGSFLVIGFTAHNITEGVGISAPLLHTREGSGEGEERAPQVGIGRLLLLTLIAGAPAILGSWIGGFAFSPLLATIFLGIGIGAIWQVIVELTRLLGTYAKREGVPLVNWYNLAGFLLGLAFMYFTAFLVKF